MTRAGLVILGLVLAGAGTAFFLSDDDPLVFAEGERVIRTSAPPATEADASFLLRNASNERIRPVVHHASCLCVFHEFVPSIVEPGAQFELRVRAKANAYGGVTKNRYRIGVAGDDHELVLTWLLSPDNSKYLLAAPLTIRAIRDDAKQSEFVLDVNYRFDGASGEPSEDLSVRFESDQVERTEVSVKQRHQTGSGFSGRLVVRVGWRSTIRPASLRGTLSAGGVDQGVTLHWNDE